MTEGSPKFLIEFSNSICELKSIVLGQLLEITSQCAPLRLKPENKPLYGLNLLDIVRTHEPHTSAILSYILNYTENEKYIILESFIERFLSSAGLSRSKVKFPLITAEKSKIDVRVLDNDFVIIIENKLMGAPFQRNQFGRYIEKVHGLGYDYSNIFVVILPMYFNPNFTEDIRLSVWRCPYDGLETSNDKRHCRLADQYRCWCDDGNWELSPSENKFCEKCIDFKAMFNARTIVIQSQLSDWLYEIAQKIDPKETILKSAVLQFADFTEGLFNTRINQHLLMDIQKLIRESILPENSSSLEKWDILNDKLEDLKAIEDAISSMKLQQSKDLIDDWYRELRPEFPMLQREVQKSFGINVNGIWIGCWCGSYNNGAPYWGFYCESEVNAEQREMVRKILEECDVPLSKSSANYISWDSTRHGAKRCRNFYLAARRLGYL